MKIQIIAEKMKKTKNPSTRRKIIPNTLPHMKINQTERQIHVIRVIKTVTKDSGAKIDAI